MPTCAARPAWCRRRSPATCAVAGPAPSAIWPLAVNGRVEAVGRSFYLAGDATEHFAFNVPEGALREGQNKLEVFEVVTGERLLLLARS